MVALVVTHLPEVHRAPLQLAERVVEVAVHRTRVHHRHARRGQSRLVVRLGLVEEVGLQGHVDARIVDHTLHPGRVPVRGQALPRVLEIAVVVVEAHRQAVDDARGQVLRIGLPLLARVVLDERLVQGAADQRNALVVEVLRVRARQFAGLLVDQGLRLGRRVTRVEELVDGPEVDRQGIHLAVVRGVHAVHVVREACETVHIVPDPLVGRVEQVRAVLVDLRAGLLVHVAVRVAADMVAHVDDLDPHAQVLDGLLGHGQAEQARAHDHQIGIFHRFSHKNNLPNSNHTKTMCIHTIILPTYEHVSQKNLLVSEDMRPRLHGSNSIGLVLGSQTLPILFNPTSKSITFKHAFAETPVVALQPCHPITVWRGHQC